MFIKVNRLLLLVCLLSFSTWSQSAEQVAETAAAPQTAQTEVATGQETIKPAVYVKKIKLPLSKVYQMVFTALENGGYFVVFEPNIGKNLEHFAQRWGNDYNKNKLEAIRSMVFCNAWYANKVSNADPEMLALCPLHLTLTHKEGWTNILFVKPGEVAKGSGAEQVAKELEQDVIRTLENIKFY